MPEPNPEDVLLLASDAARLVLASGAETYRAEETAQAFCSALGGVEAECYATPTGVLGVTRDCAACLT